MRAPRLGLAFLCMALVLTSCFGLGCGGGPDSTPAMTSDLSLPQLSDASAWSDAAVCDGCSGDGGLLPLYAKCATNDQCQSMNCHFSPGMGSNNCTKACAMDSDCPAPSPGCNKIGLCRVP